MLPPRSFTFCTALLLGERVRDATPVRHRFSGEVRKLTQLGALLLLTSACSESSSVSSQPVSSSGGSDSSFTGDAVESVVTDDRTEELETCDKWLDGTSGESMFEPPNVPNVSLDPIGDGSLTLYSSTFRSGPNGLELYAGICNDSGATLCGVALQVEFYDQADELIGIASGAVQSGRLYRFSESPYPISCVAPGQTAMAALTSLPVGLALANLKSVGHRFPAFVINDAAPLAGVSVTQVDAFETAGGIAFRGIVTNNSDSPMKDPEVSVFPITEGGRPVGNVSSTATVEIPPGGTWAFETSTVVQAGAKQVAFAAATFVTVP